jgi:hypothetical protein
MHYAKLLKDFDVGIREASAQWEKLKEGKPTVNLSIDFAPFVFYDKKAVNHESGSVEKAGLRKHLLESDTKTAILWEQIHTPLARIIREVIPGYYAGFATLFTIFQSAQNRRYSSMALDLDLDADGFRHLELSRWQFVENDSAKLDVDVNPKPPFVLTDIVLHSQDNEEDRGPIIFFWRPKAPGDQPADQWETDVHLSEPWAHVFVTDEIQKVKTGTGINMNPDWNRESRELGFKGTITEDQFYKRLREADKDAQNLNDDYKRQLRNRFNWTVTYLAYGCETFLKRQLNELAIVCIPASFSGKVSSALYLPICCSSSSSEFSQVVEKILNIARALATPLRPIYELSVTRTKAESEGILQVIEAMTHELSKQTHVLFSNRLRPLSDVFTINNLPRCKNSWPEPAGKISVSDDVEHTIAEWLVCPAPALFKAIRAYLTLWAGSPGSLTHLGVNSDSLPDFLEAAVEVAILGRLAELSQGSTNLKNLEDYERELEKSRKDRKQLPEVTVIITGMPARLINQKMLPSQDWIPLNLLFRAIVSVVSNALKHTPENKGPITLTAETSEKGLKITILNCRKKNDNTSVGKTEHVLRSCLEIIGSELDAVIFGPKDASGGSRWITQFVIRRDVFYRERWVPLFLLEDPL